MARGRHRPFRGPWWARVCIWFGVILMVASGGTLVGGNIIIGRLTGSVETDNLLGDASANVGEDLDGPINLLLVGSDYRRTTPDEPIRADTIIVVHVPATHDRAYLISFPRDTRVDIPEAPNGHGGYVDKINAAFALGALPAEGETGNNVANGFQLLAQTIHETTGIRFTSGAVINFYGFTRVVHELGGVYMCVEPDRHGNTTWESEHGNPPRVFTAGCQTLDEHAALDYIRQRYQFPNGDYDRLRHQQEFIRAILEQALQTGFADPTRIGDLVEAAGDALLVDDSVPLINLAWTLRNLRPGNLQAIRVPTVSEQIGGTWFEILLPEAEDLFEAVNNETIDQWLVAHSEYVNPL